MLDNKNHCNRNENAVDGHSWTISEFKDISIETTQTESQRGKKLKSRLCKNYGVTTEGLTYM